MPHICTSAHRRCCVTPFAAPPLVVSVLVLLLTSSLPLVLPAATTSHVCLGKQACQALEGSWTPAHSDGSPAGQLQQLTLTPAAQGSRAHPCTGQPASPETVHDSVPKAKQLPKQQQQEGSQAAGPEATNTNLLGSLRGLGYFGLWKALLYRLHLVDGQLPDTFFVQPGPPRVAGFPGAAHEQCPARPKQHPTSERFANTSEAFCPVPWRQSTLPTSLAENGALEQSWAQRPAPMCPAGGPGPFSPPPEGRARPPNTALAIQVHVPSHRRQGVQYTGAGRGLRGLLRRWLLGNGGGANAGGTSDSGNGPRHVSVPSLRRWGLDSPAARTLVRVELLWLLDKAYVALTLLFLMPVLLGGALAGAAELVDWAVLRSERCVRRQLHARWQRQLMQQQGSGEAAEQWQAHAEGRGHLGQGVAGQAGVIEASIELGQATHAGRSLGGD